MDRLVLIDGHAILHRAYHAYPQTLKTRKGELINAVYGFSSILLSILKQLHPKYVVCAFDIPKPTFRHKEFEGYKAHRPKVDEDLIKQIPKAKGVVKTLNIPIFEKEGFEADDVIGTIAKSAFGKTNFSSISKLALTASTAVHGNQEKNQSKSNHKGRRRLARTSANTQKNCLAERALEVIIVTGDKDALQLIDNQVKVFIPARGKQPATMFDRKAFLEKYGFEPRLLVDFKALAGDASDAIPGVKGVGPKTTTNLIVKFGNLRGIYNNLDKIEEKIRAKLKQDKKQAFLSYRLAKIITNVPLKFNLSKCGLLDYDQKKVVQLFEELEFRSLINRLPGREEAKDKKKITVKPLNLAENTENKNDQMGLF